MRCLGIDIGGSSVKVVLIDLPHGRECAHAQSKPYTKPDLPQLTEAVAGAIRACLECDELSLEPIEHIGLCLPGIYDTKQGCITKATNLPAIEGVALDDFLCGVLKHAGVSHAIGSAGCLQPGGFCITTDAHAAALDIAYSQVLIGRLCCLSLGTGVGASVLDIDANEKDLPAPLMVSGQTPGHIGQFDVSLDDIPPADVGGARGTLESYIGLGALRKRNLLSKALPDRDMLACENDRAQRSPPDDFVEPLCALVRSLRICHAMYRPDHIRLAGGVGISLGPYMDWLDAHIKDGLTPLAKRCWTLGTGADTFHAARGAARFACANPQ